MRLLRWFTGGALICCSLFALSLYFGMVDINLRSGREMPRPDEQSHRSWHTVLESKSGFPLEMPDTPKYESIGDGFRSYEVWRGDARYLAQFAFFHGPAKTDADLQRSLDELAKNLDGGKWTNSNWAKREGLAAVDAFGVQSGKELRYFITAKDSLVIDLLYFGPTGAARSTDVSRFVNSLKMAQ